MYRWWKQKLCRTFQTSNLAAIYYHKNNMLLIHEFPFWPPVPRKKSKGNACKDVSVSARQSGILWQESGRRVERSVEGDMLGCRWRSGGSEQGRAPEGQTRHDRCAKNSAICSERLPERTCYIKRPMGHGWGARVAVGGAGAA